MTPPGTENPFAALPKAELHLHLEGSIAPSTAAVLALRHGVMMEVEKIAARYAYQDFNGFLEAFKWVTSLLHDPADYGLIAERLVDDLHPQNVVYAEVTVSAGVMLRRNQDVEANFAAIREAGNRARTKGMHVEWIFDATRQFGPVAAMEVAHAAARLQSAGVVAFGMGGDELAFPTADFRAVYDFARGEGLHVVAHAGEIGGPESVREAIELLGAERIGHGIAAIRDAALMEKLAISGVPLENCITSNLRTGALARQLGKGEAAAADHPLPAFLQRGLRVVLSTDDPAMFQTDLANEYAMAGSLGLSPQEMTRLAGMSFQAAFLPPEDKRMLLEAFQTQARATGLA